MQFVQPYFEANSNNVLKYANSFKLIIFHLIVLPESYSQPDVVIVSADATDDRGTVDGNYRRCFRRQAQSASHRGLSCKRLSSSAAEVYFVCAFGRYNKFSSMVLHGEIMRSSRFPQSFHT